MHENIYLILSCVVSGKGGAGSKYLSCLDFNGARKKGGGGD